MSTAGAATHAGSPSPGIRADPEVLMRIKNLELRARVVVEGFLAGLHRSPMHGFSVEFSEYRAYAPGDDLRFLDWRLLARTDRLFVKRFEDETNVRCLLLLDHSGSMAYGSVGWSKWQYSQTLVATLAWFLLQQRDAVGLLSFSDQIGQAVPPRYRPGQFHRLLVALQRLQPQRPTDLRLPLHQAVQSVRRRSLLAVVSDCLAPVDFLQHDLGLVRAAGHEVILFRVLDRREVDLDLDRPAMFQDMETGRRLYVDPEAVRTQYQRRFQEHARQLRQACLEQGVDLVELLTDQPLEDALLAFLAARMRRGRLPLRRRPGESRRGGR